MLRSRPIYAQRENLEQVLAFLSRDLHRFKIDHIILSQLGIWSAGICYFSWEDTVPILTKDHLKPDQKTDQLPEATLVGDHIDLILTNTSYQKFWNTLVHQRFLPCANPETDTFWDCRTGYILQVCLEDCFIETILSQIQPVGSDADQPMVATSTRSAKDPALCPVSRTAA
ncbi:MAG: hypothetical protein VKJ24_02875 [Synechococcales bacterium]|nr:hypothetical protein [Synechococcales bacterium]